MARRVGGGEAAVAARISQSNTKSNIEIAEPQTFDRETEKVLGFLTAYRCYELRSLGLDQRTTLVLEKYKRTR